MGLLVTVATIDLIATAILHANGLIVEQNPLMRPLIERSEWLFAGVKALTIVGVYVVMRKYGQANRDFVRKAALIGTGAYVLLWSAWFATGTAHNLKTEGHVPEVVLVAPQREASSGHTL